MEDDLWTLSLSLSLSLTAKMVAKNRPTKSTDYNGSEGRAGDKGAARPSCMVALDPPHAYSDP